MKKILTNYKLRSFLCASIAFVAVVIDKPTTMIWMYEPKTPAKFKK